MGYLALSESAHKIEVALHIGGKVRLQIIDAAYRKFSDLPPID